MIDFSNYKMIPKIKCDKVSDDSYPVENLIEKDLRKRDTGFMTYSVTKPPVEVIIDLVCKVNLKVLKIWTQIGSLKSTGFDIFAKNKNEEFMKIATGECEEFHQVILFVSPDKTELEVNDSTSKTHYFFSKSLYLLKGTSSLKIVIRKTHRWVTPVIKKIEIWGYPSGFLDKEDKNKFWNLWRHEEIDKNCFIPQKSETPKKIEEPFFEIPEEFLDEITYEIMSIPMTLPSGKTVDQLTLEKHNKIEETWGRMPSDPFTGQTFTEKRKPILNAALKSRIDGFLLKNSNNLDIKNIPRTVSSNLKPNFKRPMETCCLSDQKKIKLKTMPEAAPQVLMKNSLNDAVRKALLNTTRYSKISDYSPTENCFKCKKNENLYKISICQHFICRNCSLTSSSTSSGLKTCMCGRQFNQTNVEKYHNKITNYS